MIAQLVKIGIQHPLAECWIELEAASLLIAKAAFLYDTGAPAGGLANAAKYFAAEAGFKAATQAVMTLGEWVMLKSIMSNVYCANP